MRLLDSLKFVQKFLNNVAQTDLLLFILLLNYHYFGLLHFHVHLLLYLYQLRERDPVIDIFKILFDDNYQIFKIWLPSNVGSEVT